MRLVSANLQYKTAWASNVLFLVAADADVIAVQECPEPEYLSTLAKRLGGYEHRIAPSPTGLHTGLLWAPHVYEVNGGDKYADRSVWHGFTSSTLVANGWPCPITYISAHLIPHDADAAVGEARFLQTRVRRQGYPGVLIGDLNHLPLIGPEPDWSQVPLHNRASRTILNQERPENLVGDRRVGLALTRGGLVDVAGHRFEVTGDESLLEYTGVHGRVRVDQCWVTGDLAPAIAGYTRLDHHHLTDHHPIQIDLDLESLDPIAQVEFH